MFLSSTSQNKTKQKQKHHPFEKKKIIHFIVVQFSRPSGM